MSKGHLHQGNGTLPGGGGCPGDFSDDESTPLTHDYGDAHRSGQEEIQKGWDIFQNTPPKHESGSMADKGRAELVAKITLLIVYGLVFAVVLVCGIIAKGTVLLMTSQLKADRLIVYCNRQLGRDRQFVVQLPEEERITWIWCIIIAFAVPEVWTFCRSLRMIMFKKRVWPWKSHFLTVFFMETCHVLGLALMFFRILPDLDVVKGAMLASSMCFVPGLLGLLSRNKNKDENHTFFLVIFDMAALLAQFSAFMVWPMFDGSKSGMWLIPVSLVLISCGWWENYVSNQSNFRFVKTLAEVKKSMLTARYSTYMFVSIWKISTFFISGLMILYTSGQNVVNVFSMLSNVFGDHKLTVQVAKTAADGTIPDLLEFLPNGDTETVITDGWLPLYALLIQTIAAYMVYIWGKWACKILIQPFSYALPVMSMNLVTITLLITACGLRDADPCFLHGWIPDYLFFTPPPNNNFEELFFRQYGWCWGLWFISHIYFTFHIWNPKCARLASTEKLFVRPYYDGLIIDVSMGLNRKRDDVPEVKVEDLAEIEKEKGDGDYETIYEQTDSASPDKAIKRCDHVPRIFACATMWHETKVEMMEFLKSILRLDFDQSARRLGQKYLKIVDPDYYEFETHIFFDDAFELSDHSDDEIQVNIFVKRLIETLDEAASDVHGTIMHVRAPKKIPTPYGGRLVWTLPGKTKMYAHLKDKSRIRHRKRWSQVMYMYYLLGHKLMDLPISIDRREVIGENTYLLTLDGDIDFQPSAVHLLVDLMKKNKNLGAACGRIHPLGSGWMVWYQKFEYAIGHWLQKATEHMIGCVLCSPGCFSLFRGKALMDNGVMKKYTTRSDQARHYVQYDQGEDRWLCTLLLQRGYRVEYSAASDAYTHAPEGFNEFYNQRRRWVPSTIANIMDLLMDSKRTIAVNDNISKPYITYQILLMGGTILGPGTIFLMLVGACVAAFKIDNWTSFYYNIIPIAFFMLVCFTCKSNIQLLCATILSTGYALLMMAVIVGTALQLGEDGIGSPSAIFLICMLGSFAIAAALHPQERGCIIPFPIYILAIPSMYLLLILYSIINLNVVTWGTREVQTKKTKKELEQERKEAEEAKRRAKTKSLLGFLQNGAGTNEDNQGSVEISLAGLFKLMLCTHGKPSEEKQQLVAIAETLEGLSSRLDTIEKAVDPHAHHRRRVSSVGSRSADHLGRIGEDPGEEDDHESETETINSQNTEARREENPLHPSWIDDSALRKGEIEQLPMQEEIFWKELLEKYLYPIDEDKAEKARIAGELKELRNKSVFGFFMCNALFVLVVFLFQLNKDNIHINWPWGIRTNLTYDETSQEFRITKEYLQLEPIGLVFVFFYFLILVIQFSAMLFHRFGTISHILSSTELFNKKKKSTDEGLQPQDAVDIVREFQRLNGMEGDYDESSGSGPGRRKTIRNLEKSRKKTQAINTLDVAFRQRFFSIQEGQGLPRNLSTRRSNKAIKAFEGRRNSIIAQRKKSQMQTLGANNIYGVAGNPLGIQPRPTRSSQISVKDVFENHGACANPAYEADDSPRNSVRLQTLTPATVSSWREPSSNL